MKTKYKQTFRNVAFYSETYLIIIHTETGYAAWVGRLSNLEKVIQYLTHHMTKL